MAKESKEKQKESIEETNHCICPNCEALRLLDPLYYSVVDNAVKLGANDVLYDLAIYLNETSVSLIEKMAEHDENLDKQKYANK